MHHRARATVGRGPPPRRGRSIREWHAATDPASVAADDGGRLSASELTFEDVVIARLPDERVIGDRAVTA